MNTHMTAKEYLESLKLEHHIDQDSEETLKLKYGDHYSDVREVLQAFNYTHEVLLKPIFACLSEEEKKRFSTTLIDSIPLDTMMARSVKVNEKEYAIVINERMLALIFAYHEIQYLSVKTLSEEEFSQKDFAKKFAPLIDSYLTANSGKALPVYAKEDISLQESIPILLLTIAGEQFILAHELAHIYLNHLEASDTTSRNFNYGANTLGQEKEYEADMQALKWIDHMIKTGNSKTPVSLCMYIEVFVLFHLIECNLGFPSQSSSHPSALNRIKNLKNNCADHFDAEGITYLNEMIKNCEDIESFRMI